MISFKRFRDEFFPARDPFDKQFGVDTSGKVSLSRLRIHSSNKSAGVHYGAVDAERFSQAMKLVPHDRPFVDFGCGKGRALIMARQAGFHRIIGVEFSPALVKCARTNLRRMGIAAELFEQDATTFTLPDEACVVFMYNPFRPPVFNTVIDKLVEHGRVHLIYVNPWHKDVVEQSGQFTALVNEPGLYIGAMV